MISLWNHLLWQVVWSTSVFGSLLELPCEEPEQMKTLLLSLVVFLDFSPTIVGNGNGNRSFLKEFPGSFVFGNALSL